MYIDSTVFLIEEDVAVRYAISISLAMAGFKVEEYTSGNETRLGKPVGFKYPISKYMTGNPYTGKSHKRMVWREGLLVAFFTL